MSALLKLRVGRSLGVPPLQGAFPSLLDFKANNDGGSARRKKRLLPRGFELHLKLIGDRPVVLGVRH